MPVNAKISLPVLSNDANGICVDQTTGAAGSLTLDGALVSGGVATATAAQIISIEGAGNSATVVFTITGTDADGNSRSEDVTGLNANTVTTTGYFKTVTAISVDAAITGNAEIGWLAADGMVTKTVPLDYRQNGFAATVGFNELVTGMTLSGQYTLDDPQDSSLTSFQDSAWWVAITSTEANSVTLSGVTADAVSNLSSPVRAVRFIETVGSTTATGTVYVLQGNTH